MTVEPGSEEFVDELNVDAAQRGQSRELTDRTHHLAGSQNALLRADEVVAGYLPGVNILNSCDFYVNDGELVGIIGPSST